MPSADRIDTVLGGLVSNFLLLSVGLGLACLVALVVLVVAAVRWIGRR